MMAVADYYWQTASGRTLLEDCFRQNAFGRTFLADISMTEVSI